MTTARILPGRGRPRDSERPSLRPANPVRAAQYDLMRAPVWTTSPAPATRAGADDHKRIDSRGYRC